MRRMTSSTLLWFCVITILLASVARAQLLVGTVPVGNRPNSIAIVHAPSGTKIYIANSGEYSVTVIDAATQSTATVQVGSTTSSDAPQGPYFNLAANEQTGNVYVANSDDGTVTVIHPDNSTTTIDLGGSAAAKPFAIALNANTNTIYVADRINAKLWIIDGSSNRVTSVASGSGSRSLAVNRTTNRVYVANEYDNTVTVYDAAKGTVSTANVGLSPWKVIVNETANQAFVANAIDNSLTIIDGNDPSVVSSYPVGADPVDLATDDSGAHVYLADYQNGCITAFATGQSNFIVTAAGPLAVQMNPADSKLYVLDTTAGELAIVTPVTHDVLSIPAGKLPVALAIDDTGKRAYVVNQADSTVSIFDLSVQLKKTVTTLLATPSFLSPGTNVTLTATVSSTAAIPTGTVKFFDATHNTALATVPVGANGIASYSTQSFTDGGGYSIIAYYSGDLISAPSHSDPIFVEVLRDFTSTALTATPQVAALGQIITMSATTQSTGSHPPTGSVGFYEVSSQHATLLGTVALVDGSSVFQTASLTASSHTLIASYSGDPYNAPSTSDNVNVIVNSGIAAPTATTLSAYPNPATLGSAVVLTAYLSTTGPHPPTGLVTLYDGATVLGQSMLTANGAAALTVSNLATGTHSIIASYAGDAYNAPSVSAPLLETINGVMSATTTRLSSSPNPATAGANVTFTAQVGTAGSQPLSGSVTFQEGSSILRTVPVNSSGIATFSISTLASGTHAIVGLYGGDSYNGGSTSNVVSQVISSPSNPTPRMSALLPSTAIAGASSLALTVNGSNFVSGASVLWNGATRPTTYVDASNLTATISASDLTSAENVSVTVVNPAPGGGVSNAVTFTITPQTPPANGPVIAALSPAVAKAGSGAFLLTVRGSFDAGATILWAGSARVTSPTNNGLQASIQSDDIVSTGTVDITVQNPDGATSPPIEFVIDTKAGTPGAFTVSSTTSAIDLQSGDTTVLPITFSGLNSSATVTARCVNLPANASCSYTAGSVTMNTSTGAAGSYPVTIIFTGTESVSTSGAGKLAVWSFVFPVVGLCFTRRKRLSILLSIGALMLLLTVAACGGNTQSPVLPVPSQPVTTTTQSSLPITLTLH